MFVMEFLLFVSDVCHYLWYRRCLTMADTYESFIVAGVVAVVFGWRYSLTIKRFVISSAFYFVNI